jgi:NAD(P)-dependent dehydrogenase (short-subunit alcohol dehydrogenase family)
MRFDDKVVLITGAAGNLGQAVAAAFAEAGAKLALLDLDVQRVQAAQPAALCVATNLLDAASVERAVDAAATRFGRIDVLCNIAGGFRMGPPVHETTDELWSSMLDLNARSVVQMARAVVPRMLRAGSGRIVNVAAMAGLGGKAGTAAYCASKSATIRLTESMDSELREQGINVNCVMPSIIDTPQNRAAMPDADPSRWVAPAALAAVILFLASEEARAIHGAAIPVVGLS